jgi:NitT/TauT family transport system ATP-binding protein
VIRFERVSLAFDALHVFDGLDLHIDDGQIVGIVGPSGVGKTTVLKLISGILKPDAGTVRVTEKTMGYIFQEPRLLPWRTAVDNVAVVLRPKGRDRREAREVARVWLEKVGLKGFADYHPAELSGGMAQRVSIARAFAVEPDLLLLDEPFSNMDASLKSSLMRLLSTMIAERPTTVVYVTHDLIEALQLADRIVELAPGRPPRELDLQDRRAVALEWLGPSLGRL